MRTSSALPIVLLAAGAAAQNSTTCTDGGLFIVVGRGTGEDPGVGVTGVVAEAISKALTENSKIQAVDYPATFTDPDYNVSEKEGVDDLQELLTTYHQDCPDDKIAYLGYSQGGQIAMDAFCGGSGGIFSTNKAVPESLVDDSVVAIVLFGDPTHVANATYNKGTSKKNGIFVRKDISVCEGYNDILRSYCDTGDVYCDSGNDRIVHSQYVTKYGTEIAEFVVDQFEKSRKSSSSTATATATTAAPTSSGTGTPATESGSETASPSGSTTPVPENAASGLVPGMGLAIAAPLMMAVLGLML